MPKNKTPKTDNKLKAFLKGGGRKNAEADFDTILKKAVKPNKPK
jgi:hypothetical protein